MNEDLSGISRIQEEKKVFRHEIESRVAEEQENVPPGGRLAELLRRSPAYRSAKHVFVDPGPILQQVRVNCLADGKELIMPSAGLKEGFYFFKPYIIPFRDLAFAVTEKGAARFGRRLDEKQIAGLDLSLLVSGAEAVDRQGGRLGDGSGFFDLSYAILHTLGGVSKTAQVAVLLITQEQVVDEVPVTCWDVPVNLLVTQDGVHPLADTPSPSGQIYWEHLPAKRIRKMKPLWLISSKMTNDSGQKA